MLVYAKVKALAKKKPVVENKPIVIPDGIETANQLVEAVVRKSVREFNQQETDKPLFPYLSKEELANMEVLGKIGFGDKKNDAVQDEEAAVSNALECYQDGIFRMFINEEEAGYGHTISIQNEDEIIFLRLTMLAGRLW